MGKTILIFILLFSPGWASAQKKTPEKKKSVTFLTQPKANPQAKQGSVMLNSSGTYPAYADSANNARRLQINDPVVKLLKANAQGANIQFNRSGLIGVPVGTYGFAHGKILLYSNAATSSGGSSGGSGAVGTGTSAAGVGTSGPTTGINGKSPYAGFGPYGDRITPFKDITTNKWGTGNALDSTNKRRNHE